MKALDTNILLHYHREELPHHRRAVDLVKHLAEGRAAWALPWPCVYEFLRVTTHIRVFSPPSPITLAWTAVSDLMRSPSVTMLGETPGHQEQFDRLISEAPVTGNLVHDAHIATLLLEHGVTEFLTLDGDFRRFPGVHAVNPFREER